MREARQSSVKNQYGVFGFLLLVWLVAFLLSLPIRGETLTPEQREELVKKNLAIWQQISPEQRGQLQNDFLAFLRLDAGERQKLLRKYQVWKKLSPAEQDKVRTRVARWQALPESERAARLARLREPASRH